MPLPKTLRRWTIDSPFPHQLYTGRLEGVPLMIVARPDPHDLFTIYCDEADRATVDAWLAARARM